MGDFRTLIMDAADAVRDRQGRDAFFERLTIRPALQRRCGGRRLPVMRELLVGVSEPDQFGIAEGQPEKPQAGGNAVGRETHRHGDRGRVDEERVQ